jgi:hypothetical protein
MGSPCDLRDPQGHLSKRIMEWEEDPPIRGSMRPHCPQGTPTGLPINLEKVSMKIIEPKPEGVEGRTPLSGAHTTLLTHAVTPDSPEEEVGGRTPQTGSPCDLLDPQGHLSKGNHGVGGGPPKQGVHTPPLPTRHSNTVKLTKKGQNVVSQGNQV